MDLAQIPDKNKDRKPYRGRGTPGKTMEKSPLPEATTPSHGEEHGVANAWATRARRYRELARLRTRGNSTAAGKVAYAILLKGPSNSDELWKARDTWTATGSQAASPEEVKKWGLEAEKIVACERRRVAKARGDAFVKWAEEAWRTKPGNIYEWCKQEKPAPIVATKNLQGEWVLQANQVVGEATRKWSELWCGAQDRDVILSFDFVETLPELDPLQPRELWNIIRRIGTGKAVGMDAWGPAELKALPWQAIVELTNILNQIEKEGEWPEGLRGALVALLPKKDDTSPLSQRPISLLPFVYRIWAASRAHILKKWIADNGHSSAWGTGIGRGADTAAWMGAMEAEVAAAQ
eukprot:9848072-Heterocapsa_arctica.AAC.1